MALEEVWDPLLPCGSHPVATCSDSFLKIQSHPLVYTLWLLSHYDSRVETTWLQSLKYLLPGLLEKRFANPGVAERALELEPGSQET